MLDEVKCTGNETEFTQCSHAGWESNNCDHSEDVSISCFVESPTQLYAGTEGHCRLSSFLDPETGPQWPRTLALLYPPSERSETGGYTVFTYVCLCVCLSVRIIISSSELQRQL